MLAEAVVVVIRRAFASWMVKYPGFAGLVLNTVPDSRWNEVAYNLVPDSAIEHDVFFVNFLH